MRRDRTLRDHAVELALVIVAGAFFPRLARPLVAKAGPRGIILHIALQTAFLFAVRQWAFPYMQRVRDEEAARRDALRAELGREPTELELAERLLREKGVL